MRLRLMMVGKKEIIWGSLLPSSPHLWLNVYGRNFMDENFVSVERLILQ